MTPEALNSLTDTAARHFQKPKPKPAPFSLRLSADERAELEARAHGEPLGAFIKSHLFGSRRPKQAASRRIQNIKAMARALALLGQSRIASNLNQLAKAANIGSLPVTPEVEADLELACVHVAEIVRF